MAFNFSPMTTAEQAQQWLASSGLAGLPQDQAISMLAKLMGSGQLSSQIDPGVGVDAGPGWNAITPSFDPSYAGGDYGRYLGRTGEAGPEVQFQPQGRDDGWLSNNIDWVGPLAVGGAMFAGAGGLGALGGAESLSGASDFGSLAGSASGDMLGAESWLAQAPMTDSLVSGVGMPSSIAGSGLGAGLDANGVLGAMAAAPTIGMGNALSQAAGGFGSSAAGAAGSGMGQLIGSGLGAIAGGLSSLGAPDSQTTTQTRGTDPRIDATIFNDLYPQLKQQMAQGPSNGLQGAFNISDEFLSKGQGNNTWNAINNASMNQIGSNIQAPGMQAAQSQGVGYDGRNAMNAANLRDPSQQGTNLQPGFDQYIYGDQGANPYLQGALQRGGDQARSNFGSLLQDMSQNFSENVLGNIRGGAIQAGGFGGSRQGLAEGIAGRGFAQAASRAAENYGRDLNSTMVGGQSANFMQGRGLGAGLLGGLSGQQYGQEQQRAGLQQGANQTNAGLGYQGAALGQQNNQFNAGLTQGANANNLQSQLGTQNLNANVQNQGIGNAWNQFRGATDLANANSNFGFNRTTAGMQAFAPYAQMYGTQQQTQPLYNNPWSSVLGGAMTGAQLGKIWS